jgi:osmoprotectant transport system permease protein
VQPSHRRAALHYATTGIAAALVLLIPLLRTGRRRVGGSSGRGPAYRSAPLLVLVGSAGLVVLDGLQRARAGLAAQLTIAVVIAAGFAAMAEAGIFDALSLAREYHTRQAGFAGALTRHIVLVAAAIGPAVLIGFPLGVAAVRRPAWQDSLFAVLNLLQTVPSIALFGLLLVPLSALATAVPSLAALGIGGIGMAPAIIALVLYALLRWCAARWPGSAGSTEPSSMRARHGLTRRQRFWQVELPLAHQCCWPGYASSRCRRSGSRSSQH